MVLRGAHGAVGGHGRSVDPMGPGDLGPVLRLLVGAYRR